MRPRPCLECSIQTSRAAKERQKNAAAVPSQERALAASTCADGSCALRADPLTLFMRWLRPPPPRDPALALKQHAALLASARGAPAAAGAAETV